MGLFKPIWMIGYQYDYYNLRKKKYRQKRYRRKREQAYAYIQGLTDQDLIKKIALEAPCQSVRAKAIEKIDDDRILLEISTDKKTSNYIQEAAVANIKDQTLLSELLMSDNAYEDTKKAALENITDQDILADLAMKDLGRSTTAKRPSGFFDFRNPALHKINDQNALLKVALGASDKLIAHSAAYKITDENIKAKLPKKVEKKRIPEEWEYRRYQCTKCRQELIFTDGFKDEPWFHCGCSGCKEPNNPNWEIIRTDKSIVDLNITYVLICPTCHKSRKYAGLILHLKNCTCGFFGSTQNAVPVHLMQSGW